MNPLVLLILCVNVFAGTELQSARATGTPKGGLSKLVCLAEGAKLAGRAPVGIRGKIRAPKIIRHVPPKYPELPPDTTGSGMWIGEALIDTSGHVTHVWSIRELRFTPPFPAFNRAIVDAIRQWQFEPLVIDKTPVPVCMTVTVNINWA